MTSYMLLHFGKLFYLQIVYGFSNFRRWLSIGFAFIGECLHVITTIFRLPRFINILSVKHNASVSASKFRIDKHDSL